MCLRKKKYIYIYICECIYIYICVNVYIHHIYIMLEKMKKYNTIFIRIYVT